MVSLAVTAALAALSGWLARLSPALALAWSAVNLMVSIVVATALFAALTALPEGTLPGRRDDGVRDGRGYHDRQQ